jgi:hypothetical protein
MADQAVRGFTRVINPNPPHAPQDARQASDLISLVVLALVLANIVLFMALSS